MMKPLMIILVVLVIAGFAIVLPARASNASPAIVWQKSLGGSAYDNAFSIILTSDGGYIVTGTSFSNDGDVIGNRGEGDYWIVKLDAKGNLTWQKSLGGSWNDEANDIVETSPNNIAQTSDGGYIIAGYSESNDGDVTGHHGITGKYIYIPDAWIVKLDAKGNLTWQKSLGGSQEDNAHSVAQTSDGGYIIAGYSESNDGDVTGHHGYSDSYMSYSSDAWVVKLDAKGNLTWQRSLGGSDGDRASSIVQTSDGGYIISGYSLSNDGDVTGNHGGQDYWIVKLDAKGNLSWQRTFGGSGSDLANSIILTSDGGYVVAGSSASTDGDVTSNKGGYDYWIVKLSQALYTPTPRIITNKTTPAMYTDTFQMSCTYPPCPSQAFCPEGQTCPGGCGLTCPKNYTLTWTVTSSTKPTGTQKSPLSYALAGVALVITTGLICVGRIRRY